MQLGILVPLRVHFPALARALRARQPGSATRRRDESVIDGQAPWGTKRLDTREDRILDPGESSSPGGGETVLWPIVTLPHWEVAADRLLSGASDRTIEEERYEKGLRGPH
jgi:hypothetical protein